jgi:hypothetical protein
MALKVDPSRLVTTGSCAAEVLQPQQLVEGQDAVDQ